MRRLLVFGMVVLAACTTGQTTSSPSTTDADSTTAAPGTTVTPGGTTSTEPEPSPGHDRELAPDFSLVLADGETFRLAETDKPVYLVFWAEWCPVCRRELPVVDRIAVDYADRIDFIAPAWKSVPDAAVAAAAQLFPSGAIRWGLDNDEIIFGLYGVPYQPVTILIAADGTVFEQWPGVRDEAEIRASLDALLEVPADSA